MGEGRTRLSAVLAGVSGGPALYRGVTKRGRRCSGAQLRGRGGGGVSAALRRGVRGIAAYGELKRPGTGGRADDVAPGEAAADAKERAAGGAALAARPLPWWRGRRLCMKKRVIITTNRIFRVKKCF